MEAERHADGSGSPARQEEEGHGRPDSPQADDDETASSSGWEEPLADGEFYGDFAYWEARYEKEVGVHDWFFGYETLKPLLDGYFKHQDRILHVGAGTSTLTEEMVCDGYKDIVSCDYSPAAVHRMELRYEDDPQWSKDAMTWEVADVRSMPSHADGSFDAVLDKGTADALACAEDEGDIVSMMREVSRVLRPGGVYVQVSYGEPSSRLGFLLPEGEQGRYGWDVGVHAVEKAGEGRVVSEVQRGLDGIMDWEGTFTSEQLWHGGVHFCFVATKR